ncbi:MAG: FKBP-type peptidyl-prolyl cis-trans isomerase [Thermodesulfobacteriota bacterium]
MQKVEKGLFVSVDYTGTLQNGDIFDSSRGRHPLEVEIGAGHLIKGFEAALMGMSLNEKKRFTLAPEEAYGHKNEEYLHTFDRSEIPPEITPEVGETVALTSPDGHEIPARIAQVDDQRVIVDLNHPLAGESLTFDIQIVGISDTPTQENHGCGCDCGCDCGSDEDCSMD